MSSSRHIEDGGGSSPRKNTRGEGRRKKNQLPEYDDIGETPLVGQEKRLATHDDGAAAPPFRYVTLLFFVLNFHMIAVQH